MNLIDLRKQIKNQFEKADIEVGDADFILAEVLGVKRTELALIAEIDDDKLEIIKEAVEKRLKFMPIEKIFHKAYFYGLEFDVDENVLSPRPETELLVENALRIIKENNFKTVLDLCTGSGCIAISIKKNADIDVTASDVSRKALRIAKRNAKQNDVEIQFVQSNMFENLNGEFDLICSNPPYIDSDEVKTLDKEVQDYDPVIALDGGELGLKFYNIIHDNLRKYLSEHGIAILEIGEDQKNLIQSIFNDFELVDCVKDLNGHDRIMILKK